MGKSKKQRPASLAVFAWGGLTPSTHECIVRSVKAWPSLKHLLNADDALIDRARSRAASLFLQSSPSYTGDVLVMVDHDIVWQPGDLEHIVAAPRRGGGVVGGGDPN